MLTFSKLGKKGNLGNQLFQIASVIGLANKYGHNYAFPADYPYFDLSKTKVVTNKIVKEQHYHFHEWDIPKDTGIYDIDGWLQSYKYWQDCEKEIRELFTFPPLADPTPKTAIGISARRGDFVGNPNYHQLDIQYYISALFEHFPDWQQRTVYLFSDDTDYCKHHFGHLPNCHVITGNPIEQLTFGQGIKNWIVSNSTFSWWLAYLSNATKVIRPIKNMAGALAAQNDEKDYWPESWIIHEPKPLPAKDVTFTIPVTYDHDDRRHNLNLSVCLLQRAFDTNVIIGEGKTRKFEYMSKWAKYMYFEGMEVFHRTKMLNDMAIEAETGIIVNWDCDTVLPPLRVWSAIEALRKGADMVYPYDGNVYHVPRMPNFEKLEKALDTGVFGLNTFRGKNGKEIKTSVGHAVFFNKESFIMGGMENEQMISYAPEDWERYDRFKALGFKIERIDGPMYHIEHFRGPDSSALNPKFKTNHLVLDEQRKLSPEELRKQVDNWPWVNKYTEAYYGRIIPGAIESAIAVAEVLPFKPKTIIDVGCGCGEWSKGWPETEYFGVDYGIMKRKLLIPEDHFTNFDLNSDLILLQACAKERGKVDLVLCLEVLEHIKPENAKKCIAFLCDLSDKVLFSAAIPFQGGNGHVNEQWQTWWADLFAENGFYPAKKQPDIRNNSAIEVWYKQNIVLYEKDGKGKIIDYVHPQMWLNHMRKK